eukprot:191887-Alexandrium_andersonii.AAC.1
MSASLVGSEMCIRDRDPYAAPLRGALTRLIGAAYKLFFNRSLAAERPEPCLLYTSDAADDM